MAFLENMAGAGRLLPLDDHLMDAGSAVAGCGPAFVDLFIEAMADGGVACGLTRPMAMECAAQTLIGAARLMLETGRHPGALKDAVCSPGRRHHPGRPGAGGRRVPQRGDGGGHRRL